MRLAAAVVPLALLLPTPARAEPPAPTPTPTPTLAPAPAPTPSDADTDAEAPPPPTWYGYQTAIPDVIAACALVATLASDQNGGGSPQVAVLSLLTYGLGAPIVHLAHGRGGIAAADVLMRVGAPLTLALAGEVFGQSQVQSTHDSTMPLLGAGAGFFLGMIGASVVDAAVLAYAPAQPPRENAGLTLAPSVAVGPERGGGQRGTVGVGGVF